MADHHKVLFGIALAVLNRIVEQCEERALKEQFFGLVAHGGGVVQLTRTAAIEYATQGVRVNCLCPGVIDTPMVERFTHGQREAGDEMRALEPFGRLGSAREVAELALFLASDRSSFITGAVIPR